MQNEQSDLDTYQEDEPTLPSFRNPLFKEEEKTYPGIGLALAFGTGLAFWGLLAWAMTHC